MLRNLLFRSFGNFSPASDLSCVSIILPAFSCAISHGPQARACKFTVGSERALAGSVREGPCRFFSCIAKYLWIWGERRIDVWLKHETESLPCSIGVRYKTRGCDAMRCCRFHQATTVRRLLLQSTRPRQRRLNAGARMI
jgi:hypothetical protein